MRTITRSSGDDLGRAGLVVLDGGAADGVPGSPRTSGWLIALAAALFLTAFLGMAQLVGPEAPSLDEEDSTENARSMD